MGVISCSRSHCDNIMCDTQTPQGNICNECKEDFKNYVKENQIQISNNYDIKDALEVFLNTHKTEADYSSEKIIDEFFEFYTRD